MGWSGCLECHGGAGYGRRAVGFWVRAYVGQHDTHGPSLNCAFPTLVSAGTHPANGFALGCSNQGASSSPSRRGPEGTVSLLGNMTIPNSAPYRSFPSLFRVKDIFFFFFFLKPLRSHRLVASKGKCAKITS